MPRGPGRERCLDPSFRLAANWDYRCCVLDTRILEDGSLSSGVVSLGEAGQLMRRSDSEHTSPDSGEPDMGLPELPSRFVYRLDLAQAATQQLARERPVHRWFTFPHSYSPELVEAILDHWALPKGSELLDPFVGAGTTLRVAQDRGCPALGTDLSLLAVLVSSVKVTKYDPNQLATALSEMKREWHQRRGDEECGPAISLWVSSERLRKAFTPSELDVLAGLRQTILGLDERVQSFFLVALLGILPAFSRAVADGGWFRWVERPDQSKELASTFWRRAQKMLEDVPVQSSRVEVSGMLTWAAEILDARLLSALQPRCFDALVTSPPYPNRHDYSRVFQIELLALGEGEAGIRALRHKSLRSHVEARPPREDLAIALNNYVAPQTLVDHLDRLPEKVDKRIRRMIEGYFKDMFLTLSAASDVLKPGARVALVVGNVRYRGVLFPVDEILAAIGEQIGYSHELSWVIRLRGNSAQQMGKYGRVPSRETVVMLRGP